MILVGELALWVALLMAAWGAIVSFAGGYSGRAELAVSGERALYATFACVVLATAGLLVALVTSDMSLAYVASVTSANLAVAYKVTGLWAGEAGSVLFWTLILATYAVLVGASGHVRDRSMLAYAVGTLSAITFFLLAVVCLAASPYERLTIIPSDGAGMHPRLQSPAMAVHAPMLHLGHVATAVPFALTIAGLLTQQVGNDWFVLVRRWVLGSWFFLTVGIIVGMWSDYSEIGLNGLWAWDPRQNASLLPWLTNTALLHSLLAHEKRGALRTWSLILAPSSFLLVVLGTFVTRTGLAPSVQVLAKSATGYWFGALFVIAAAAAAYLVTTRRGAVGVSERLDTSVSREDGLALTSLLLVAIAGWMVVGMLLPALGGDATRNQRVGPGFFTAVTLPLGLLLLVLVGVGSIVGWGRVSPPELRRRLLVPLTASLVVIVVLVALGVRGAAPVTFGLAVFALTSIAREGMDAALARRRTHGGSTVTVVAGAAVHDRRRQAARLVHVGVVVVCIAFAGYSLRVEHDVSLGPGESATFRDPFGRSWTFTSQGISAFEERNRQVTAVGLQTTRNAKPAGFIRSERRQYVDSRGVPIFAPSTEVGIAHSLIQDIYVVLSSETAERAHVRITFNPLVAWMWIGGLIMVLGGVLVMWPARL